MTFFFHSDNSLCHTFAYLVVSVRERHVPDDNPAGLRPQLTGVVASPTRQGRPADKVVRGAVVTSLDGVDGAVPVLGVCLRKIKKCEFFFALFANLLITNNF